MKNLGKRIRDRRKELGMTQKELAAAVGLTQGHVSRIEQGIQDISIAQLRRLESVLDISLIVEEQDNASQWFGISTLYELQQLHERHEYNDMLKLIDRASFADFFKNPTNQLRLKYWRARALTDLHRREEAEQAFTILLQDPFIKSDLNLLGKAHVGIATVLIDLEKYDSAMDHLKVAEQLQCKNPSLQYDAEFMSDLYYLMGTIHVFQNSLGDANVYLAKAMKYSADALIHPIRAHSFNIFTRAAVLAMSEEYQEALSLTFSALHLFETIGYTEGAIHAHNNIAYINKLMGNIDKANEHFDIAVSLARKHPELVNEKLRNELAKEGYTV